MAVLSSKATDGRLSFTKYVTENKRLPEIEFEIEKGLTANLFVKRGTSWEAGKEYPAGTKFKIVDKQLIDPTGLKLAKVQIGSITGHFQITKIRKPTSGNGTAYEDEVVDATNAFILAEGGIVNLKVGNITYKNMRYAIKVDSPLKARGGVKGDPKADIVICSDKLNPLAQDSIFISHKKEGGPEAFQQYGGVSQQAGEEIYKHPAVQSFLQKCADAIGTGSQLPYPIMMEFSDEKLMNMSIYGPEFGKRFSLQHTQLIGQGKPQFKKINDDTFELGFSSHMSISGDLTHFKGNGYMPVLGATFRAGRGFDYNGKRYNGARVGIYPSKLIETRGGLVKYKDK